MVAQSMVLPKWPAPPKLTPGLQARLERAAVQLDQQLDRCPLPPGFHWVFDSKSEMIGPSLVVTVIATPQLTVAFED